MKTENWVNGMTAYFYGNDIDKWKQICKDAEEGKMPTITLRGIEYALIRHGKWIQDRLVSTGGGTYGVRRCSVCESYYQDIGYDWCYCPNCGAKMDLEG